MVRLFLQPLLFGMLAFDLGFGLFGSDVVGAQASVSVAFLHAGDNGPILATSACSARMWACVFVDRHWQPLFRLPMRLGRQFQLLRRR
jgi:hypothetical protein